MIMFQWILDSIMCTCNLLEVTGYMMPKYHGYVICYPKSIELLQKFRAILKLHTCYQNLITHRLHIKAKGMFNSNSTQAHISYQPQIHLG